MNGPVRSVRLEARSKRRVRRLAPRVHGARHAVLDAGPRRLGLALVGGHSLLLARLRQAWDQRVATVFAVCLADARWLAVRRFRARLAPRVARMDRVAFRRLRARAGRNLFAAAASDDEYSNEVATQARH